MSHPNGRGPLAKDECRLIVVQDQLQPCPYLPGVAARMPLRLPVGGVTAEVTDSLLERGFRRSGDFVYTPQCPTCSECQPTRVNVHDFRWSTSLKRVLNRGDRDLSAKWSTPIVDHSRVHLFNRHRDERSLGLREDRIDADSYRSFLVDSCCDTKELSIRHGNSLIAVSTIDIGLKSISAVYTFFDPDFSRYSLGTFAILKQIQWCLANSRRFVYLGMFVADNQHLNYKARFVPQQRLRGRHWILHDNVDS